MCEKAKFDYNTARNKLILPEYGRHVQKLVEYCKQLQDRNERNRMAYAIIEVMGNLNPQIRDSQDFKQKLWDHLFIMSNYELDVDAPYPKPKPEEVNQKPEPLKYPKHDFTHRHYGRLVEALIEKAAAMEKGPARHAFIQSIANLMKKYYLTYNRESVEDYIIFNDIEAISKGKLKIKPEDFKLTASQEILAKNQYNNKKRKNKNKKRRKY
jgi:hypothetical protein